MKSLEEKELEIKVKKIILHNKIHSLLQEIRVEFNEARKDNHNSEDSIVNQTKS